MPRESLPAGDGDVLQGDGVLHVQQGQVVVGQLLGIDVHLDLVLDAADQVDASTPLICSSSSCRSSPVFFSRNRSMSPGQVDLHDGKASAS